jgi:RNA polymerase sigma factor (sigma-70 family)
VCHPAYTLLQYGILYLAERNDAARYRQKPGRHRLKDEELSAIRAVLQKITRRRVRDIEDAEDLVQETLLTMITRNPDAELKKGILAWSQGILRNKVGNYYRKNQRHSALQDPNYDVHLQEPASPAATCQETALSHKELISIIEKELARFPPEVRRVMELLVSGLNAGEIVDRLQSESYQNVINRLYRGRRRLAKELKKCGFDPAHRKAPTNGNRGTRKREEVISKRVIRKAV